MITHQYSRAKEYAMNNTRRLLITTFAVMAMQGTASTALGNDDVASAPTHRQDRALIEVVVQPLAILDSGLNLRGGDYGV
jgi:hypothetical protein